MHKELTQRIVEGWIRGTQGQWSVEKLDRELGIGSAEGKAHRRVILHRLKEEGLIKRDPEKEGWYRLVVTELDTLPWQEADTANTVDILLPFDIHELVKIFPKNILVIAGAPNAGKTAFCFNFIHLNHHRPELAHLLPIQYFTSEMGAEELKERLGYIPDSDWNFVAKERSSDFADVIHPDKINVIDYLEIEESFYLVAQELREIHEVLRTGIALIAIQKNANVSLGVGGRFSLDKPRLYLSMDSGSLTLTKAKNWRDRERNPNGKCWKFSLVNGWKFIIKKGD